MRVVITSTAALVVLLPLTLLFICGCFIRMPVRYSPHPLDAPAEAVEVIRQTLEEQHAPYAPIELEVDEEKITLLRGVYRPFPARSGGIHRTTIRYSTVKRVSLSKKNRWYAVTLSAETGVALLHVYTANVESAQRFMDAIETLRRQGQT